MPRLRSYYPDEVSKAHDRPSPRNPHPWSRAVGTCGTHTCQLNWRGEFWDVDRPHGATYLGKARSATDAFNRWKNHLMTIGERPEEATYIAEAREA